MTRLISLSLATALICLLAACNRSEGLLDNIPADLPGVAMLDIDAIAELTGAASQQPQAPHEAHGHTGATHSPQLPTLDQLYPQLKAAGADLQHVAVAVTQTGPGRPVLLVSVPEASRLKDATAGSLTWTSASGHYDTAPVWGGMLVYDGSVLWHLTANADPVATVKDLKARASKSPMSRIDWVCQALEAPGLLNLAARQPAASDSDDSGTGDGPMWITASMPRPASPGELQLNLTLHNSKGDPASLPCLSAINSALAAYIPSSWQCVAAAGLTPEVNWKAITEFIAAKAGFQARAVMATVQPMLQAIDGTVLIALQNLSADIEDNNFLLLAHMPQAQIQSIVRMISSMSAASGINPRQAGQGVWCIPQYGKQLYYGEVDGCLGLSTVGFDMPGAGGNFAQLLVNSQAALAASNDQVQLTATLDGPQATLRLQKVHDFHYLEQLLAPLLK